LLFLATDLEQYEDKPKAGINKLSAHVNRDSYEVDGRIVSALVIEFI